MQYLATFREKNYNRHYFLKDVIHEVVVFDDDNTHIYKKHIDGKSVGSKSFDFNIPGRPRYITSKNEIHQL